MLAAISAILALAVGRAAMNFLQFSDHYPEWRESRAARGKPASLPLFLLVYASPLDPLTWHDARARPPRVVRLVLSGALMAVLIAGLVLMMRF